MADRFTIDVDNRGVLKALDDLGRLAELYVKQERREAALSVQSEARARVKRRTGRTAAGITVEETHDKTGYIVTPFNEAHRDALVAGGNDQQPRNLPYWLAFGTKYMTGNDYLFAAARLEQGPHLRRLEAALQRACDEAGR